MDPTLAIIVLNHNGLEDTLRCMRSLAAVDYPALHVAVVDNGSRPDPSAQLLAEFPWSTVLRNAHNGGWSGGNNTGIQWALEHDAEQVLLLNNDTLVAPQIARRLIEAARANPELGILGPVIAYLEEPNKVMTDGFLFNDAAEPGFFRRRPVALDRASPPRLTEVDIVNGCCMMVSAAVFRRIGLIDDRFFLVHEESDFCLRARRAGFRCGLLGETLIRHKGSSSFQRSGKARQRYYDARNLYLLLRKHLATHRRGRTPLRSRIEYLKYVYYRYAIEREQDQPEAADAVIEGLCDAVAGRYGPFASRPRPAVPVVRGLFEWWRQRRARQAV